MAAARYKGLARDATISRLFVEGYGCLLGGCLLFGGLGCRISQAVSTVGRGS